MPPSGADWLEQVEDSEAVLVHNDGLTVDDAGFDGKARDGVHDQHIPIGKVIAVPRNELDLITVLPRQDAEAVVLDLVNWAPPQQVCAVEFDYVEGA